MRTLVLMSALVIAATPSAAPSAPTPADVPAGHVYFWPDPNQTGTAFDYAPPGYKEADAHVMRHAYSFASKATATVYAISRPSSGPCLYRPILPEEYSTNWVDWATKFDGVSDTTMGCAAD